ncbi:MAG: hypothetical protein QXR60_00685 [Candidatus Nanoarchaeia archaeon]
MRNVLWNIEGLERFTFTRYAVKALLIVVAALTLSLPIFFRDKASLFYGFEAYYHITHGPLSRILSFFSYLLNIDVFLVAKILPVVLGILTLLLFFEMLKKLEFRYWIVLLASLILIFSPSFIFLYSTLTDFAFVAFLFVFGAYLFVCKKEIYALIVFYTVGFFGLFPLVVASLLLLLYSLSIGKFRLFLYSIPSFAILLLSDARNLTSFGNFISDLGGPFGLGAFIVILSFFGLRSLWNDKYTHFYFYLMLLVTIGLSFFNLRVLALLNFFLVLLAALGVELLFERHWRSRLIKSLTIIILFVGLLLSAWSYMGSVIYGLPNGDVIDGLYALRDLPYGTVFSHYSREYWIDFAGRPFFSDGSLLYTRDIGYATALMESNGVSYIWIDNDMKSKVWIEEDQDLLFLLKYSKSFKEVYSNDYVTIWEFKKGGV